MSVGQQSGIDTTKITKPIQLLAAWLVGLIFVNGIFLTTATSFVETEWLAAVLVIAAVINVPVFLVSIFLLQTKFRPEMQEDHYYNEYIKDKLGRLKSEKKFSPVTINNNNNNNNNDEVVNDFEAKVDNEWDGVKLLFNPHLTGSDLVKQSLQSNDIPINAEFGHKEWIPEFVIGIGRYLTYEQIGMILNALKNTPANRVGFVNDDDDIYEWDRTVLIGSYYTNALDKTYSIDAALEIHKSVDGIAQKFYQKIFDKQLDVDV